VAGRRHQAAARRYQKTIDFGGAAATTLLGESEREGMKKERGNIKSAYAA